MKRTIILPRQARGERKENSQQNPKPQTFLQGGAPMAGANNSACNAARLVEHGKLKQSVLDRAVSNVLRQKFALRLFEVRQRVFSSTFILK
jgi:hypothetical protein